MSDQNANEKPKYESPVLVPLGGVARGTGADCAAGTNAVGYCQAGSTATADPGYCQAGTGATPGYCTAGTSAETSCTDGITAVTGACTDGTGPGA